jgi:hypothetical protein
MSYIKIIKFGFIIILLLFQLQAVSKNSAKQIKGDKKMSTENILLLPKPFSNNGLPYVLPEQCDDIFTIPLKNAVGTVQINNSLSALYLTNGDVDIHTIKSNYLNNVSGGDLSYLPPFSENVIGYTQTRRFILFNVTENHFKKLSIVHALEKYLIKGVAVDPIKNLFAFEIQYLEGKKEEYSISIVDCSDENEPKELNTIFKTTDRSDLPWCFSQSVFFIFNALNNTLQTYDAAGKSVQHPLINLIAENKKKLRNIVQLYLHPTLPFALIVDWAISGRLPVTLWVAKWGANKPEMTPVLGLAERLDCSRFEFSPDGRYVTFWNSGYDSTNNKFCDFYALKIDPDASWYIMKQIHLTNYSQNRINPSSSAWIKEKLAYVVSDGSVLYYWQFL